MGNLHDASRRTVLKTIGAGVVGGAMMSGTATGSRGNLVSQVASQGHYSYFPKADPSTWGRSTNPFDIRQGDMRWMAAPAGGGIRCHIENLPEEPRNAGFDIHLGTLGSVGEISGSWRTVQTESGSSANLLGALYFDINDDGDFFEWTDEQGNTDDFASAAGDTERFLVGLPTDQFTINDQTPVMNPFVVPPTLSTVGAIREGGIPGVDASTNIALYLGVGWPAEQESGIEELVVESLSVERV